MWAIGDGESMASVCEGGIGIYALDKIKQRFLT